MSLKSTHSVRIQQKQSKYSRVAWKNWEHMDGWYLPMSEEEPQSTCDVCDPRGQQKVAGAKKALWAS